MTLATSRLDILRRVASFGDIIAARTAQWQLESWLMVGLIAQESAGNPGALRPEPGFWRRYGANVLRAVAASATTHDDRWAA